MNLRKNKEVKDVWFKKKEYKELTDALDANETERVLDIIFAIYRRGDL